MAMSEDLASPRWQSVRLSRADLGRLEHFDQGGEGVLYTVSDISGPDHSRVLFKEYRAATLANLDTAALERFPTFARSLSPETMAWLYRRAAWPTWIVDDVEAQSGARHAVGVVMPLAPKQFMAHLRSTAGGRRIVPAKFELLLNGRHFLHSVGISISMRQKLQLLTSVAETLSFLHGNSIAVGDFSCKNVLFTLRPEPACFMIDCDSVSWDCQSAFPAGETPEWEVPAGEPLATREADLYKFALLVLRMHTGAQHHRSPARLPPTTWPSLRELVEQTLTARPADRPLITEWTLPLRLAADAAPSTPLVSVPNRPRVPLTSNGGRVTVTNGVGSPPPATHVQYDPQVVDLDFLPSGVVADAVRRVLRRILVRRPANPSILKLIVMLLGLWLACLAAFGLAVLGGVDPKHMSHLAQFGLFGSFIVFAVVALALATTEPR
jgi:hypothetical protein